MGLASRGKDCYNEQTGMRRQRKAHNILSALCALLSSSSRLYAHGTYDTVRLRPGIDNGTRVCEHSAEALLTNVWARGLRARSVFASGDDSRSRAHSCGSDYTVATHRTEGVPNRKGAYEPPGAKSCVLSDCL